MEQSTRVAAVMTMAGGLLWSMASPVAAHIGIPETEQTAGAFTVLTFSVPHGCEDSPTTTIEIELPESVLNVTPTRHPFYDVSVEIEELAEPVEGPHGEEITTRDAVVVYRANGTPLPSDQRDAMELSLQIPEDAGGTRLYFPVVQTCEVGQTSWIEIPEDGQDPFDLEHPAPFVNVAEASEGGGHGGEDTDDKAAEDDGVALGGETVSSDDDTDPVAIVALVVGALGLLLGVGGLIAARRKA